MIVKDTVLASSASFRSRVPRWRLPLLSPTSAHFDWVSLALNQLSWVSLVLTQPYWVIASLTAFHWLEPIFSGLQLDLLDFLGF